MGHTPNPLEYPSPWKGGTVEFKKAFDISQLTTLQH